MLAICLPPPPLPCCTDLPPPPPPPPPTPWRPAKSAPSSAHLSRTLLRQTPLAAALPPRAPSHSAEPPPRCAMAACSRSRECEASTTSQPPPPPAEYAAMPPHLRLGLHVKGASHRSGCAHSGLGWGQGEGDMRLPRKVECRRARLLPGVAISAPAITAPAAGTAIVALIPLFIIAAGAAVAS